MKIIGLIMIILFSSSLGLMVDNYKKRQIRYVDNLIYIGNRVSLMLSSTTPETEEMISDLKQDERLKNFDFDLNVENTPLSADEYDRIRNLFSIIGKYDADCQLKYIKEFVGYFKMLKQQYQEHYAAHHKLYITFGVLAGVAVSILLL